MAEPYSPGSSFADLNAKRSFPTAAAGIALVALLLLATALILLGRRHGGDAAGQSSAYAANLQLSDFQMSESESLSGGKSTYVDGTITNHGTRMVTGVTVQVQFPTDGGGTPQSLTVPLQLIRTREPYVDTEPVRGAPIVPGGKAEFRLIFEGVSDAWNQQQPAIQVTGVAIR